LQKRFWIFHRHYFCHHARHCRRGDLRADAAYPAGTGYLRHVNSAAHYADDDGRLYAVGGLLLLATGLRICGIKMFAVVNMLPALLLPCRSPRSGRTFSLKDAAKW
jgi:hypothetical protein